MYKDIYQIYLKIYEVKVMAFNGLDVSQFQGSINFDKVKAAGYDFVIIRAGYGRYANQVDPYFYDNYRKAKAAGLDVGCYWYSYALTPNEAVEEARVCLNTIKGKRFEYPIYFDLEEKNQFKLGRDTCSAMVTAFCETIEAAGYYSGLYISRSPLQNYITQAVAERFALWVAEYDMKLNYTAAPVGMWQNTSNYMVPGIAGNVDHDYGYIDYPTIIKTKGLNGYPKTSPNTLELAGYKKGDKNDGVYIYKKLLTIAYKKGIVTTTVDDNNVFGDGTEKATNQILKKLGNDQNGIAGPKLVKKLTDLILKG